MVKHPDLLVSRALRLWVCVLGLLLADCNAIFDISERTPRPLCADALLIDDMEDGDGLICPTSGREGWWSASGDGTVSGELNPRSDGPFEPTLIEEGARGTSRYAVRLRGSGFTAWGAGLGLEFASAQGYDAVGLGASDSG
jgi:hypothetical protein